MTHTIRSIWRPNTTNLQILMQSRYTRWRQIRFGTQFSGSATRSLPNPLKFGSRLATAFAYATNAKNEAVMSPGAPPMGENESSGLDQSRPVLHRILQ